MAVNLSLTGQGAEENATVACPCGTLHSCSCSCLLAFWQETDRTVLRNEPTRPTPESGLKTIMPSNYVSGPNFSTPDPAVETELANSEHLAVVRVVKFLQVGRKARREPDKRLLRVGFGSSSIVLFTPSSAAVPLEFAVACCCCELRPPRSLRIPLFLAVHVSCEFLLLWVLLSCSSSCLDRNAHFT